VSNVLSKVPERAIPEKAGRFVALGDPVYNVEMLHSGTAMAAPAEGTSYQIVRGAQ
jgi:hypothetical protein